MKKSKSCEADVSSELRKEVETLYKLSLPEDFYHFWKFCEELDPEEPAGEFLQHLSASVPGKDDRKLEERQTAQRERAFQPATVMHAYCSLRS